MKLAVAWQLARGLALSGRREQRWRQVGAVVGAFLATLAVIAGISVVNLGERADNVVRQRSVGLAASPEQAVMLYAQRSVIVADHAQVPMVWVDPLGDPQAVPPPPGLREWPAPGTAVLSPGLVDAGFTAADFGSRDSQAGSGAGGVIGDEGITSRTEGFVWARPAQTPAAGSGPWTASQGFGRGDLVSVEAYGDTPGRIETLFGAALLLWAPGVYLLIASATGMSPVRDERAEVLHALGARMSTIRWVAALETVVLSAVGAVAGWVVWNLLLAPMTSVPLTGRVIVPGSAEVPLWGSGLVALGVALTSAYCAAAGRVLPAPVRHRTLTHRVWKVIPLALGVLIMWGSIQFSGNPRLVVLATGLLLSVASVGLALPFVTRWVAPRVVPQRGTPAWLATQRLVHSTHLLTRPAAMVAVLVALSVAAMGVMGAIVQGLGSGGPQYPREVYTVTWEGDESGAAPDPSAHGLRHTEEWVVDPNDPAGLAHDLPPSLLTFASCQEATSFLGTRDACPEGSGWAPSVQDFLAFHGSEPTSLTTRPPGYRSVILVSAEPESTPMDVMRAFPGRDALLVQQDTGDLEFDLLTPLWVRLGIAAATVLLFAGILREAGDRVQLALRDTPLLRRIGLRQRETQAVHRWSLLVPMVLAAPIGLGLGLLFNARGSTVGYTAEAWWASTVIMLLGLAASVAGTFVAIRLGEQEA